MSSTYCCPRVLECHSVLYLPSQAQCTRVRLGSHRRILHFSLLSIDRKSKTQNTIPLHTFRKCFCHPPHPAALYLLSLPLNLTFSLLVSFFPNSPCQLWCTLWYTHQLFLWITSLDALYSLLCTQLLAATASLLLVAEKCTHAKIGGTCRFLDCTVSHTHMHTAPALKFCAGGNYELLPQVSAEKQQNKVALCICRYLNSCSM